MCGQQYQKQKRSQEKREEKVYQSQKQKEHYLRFLKERFQ